MYEDRQGITAGSFGFAPYNDAQPAHHTGVCWSAAIGRASRVGGRNHTDHWESIVQDALRLIDEEPEKCICSIRKGGRRRGRR